MKPSTLISIVIGAVLMLAGMWMYKNVDMPFLHTLAEQGVPLNPGKTVATIGVLMILFKVIESFFVAPLGEAINNRTQELEGTFTEAESLRNEMTKMKSDYESKLAETEAAARAQIQEEIRKAQDMRQELVADATAKADELKKKAMDEIAAERDRVVTGLRVQTVNLALNATQKVLGGNIDEARNRQLIEEFIDKAEVPA
ncbi:MAG: F0F1 ATP synthase subunit B [Chthonomonas sp.]|nr:F0F1 ATP synthase subunit B [Chthonomonas sp.]